MQAAPPRRREPRTRLLQGLAGPTRRSRSGTWRSKGAGCWPAWTCSFRLPAGLAPAGEASTTASADESLALAGQPTGGDRGPGLVRRAPTVPPPRRAAAASGAGADRQGPPAQDQADRRSRGRRGRRGGGRGEQDPQALPEPAVELQRPHQLPVEDAGHVPLPRAEQQQRRRRDAGRFDPPGGQGRARSPAPARPPPVRRRRHARTGGRHRRRAVPRVGRAQEPLPAGVVPGHRLPARPGARRLGRRGRARRGPAPAPGPPRPRARRSSGAGPTGTTSTSTP